MVKGFTKNGKFRPTGKNNMPDWFNDPKQRADAEETLKQKITRTKLDKFKNKKSDPELHAIEIIGSSLTNSKHDKINRPILSHDDWKHIAKSNNISNNVAESVWKRYGAWHWKQHIEQNPTKPYV